MFRLLAAFGSTSPGHYGRVIDDTLVSPHLRDILSALTGFAYGAVLSRFNGDHVATVAYLCDELLVQRDLARLDTADLEPGGTP